MHIQPDLEIPSEFLENPMHKALAMMACGLMFLTSPLAAAAKLPSMAGCAQVRLTADALLKAAPSAAAKTYSHGHKGEIFTVVMDGGSSHYLNGFWLLRRADGRRFWVQRANFACATQAAAPAKPRPAQDSWDSETGRIFIKAYDENCSQSAMQAAGISQTQAKALCDCTLAEMKKKYTPEQLVALEEQNSESFGSELEAMATRCAEKTVK